MTNTNHSAFDATGRATDRMFEVLKATGDDVVAIRVGTSTRSGFDELYDLLVKKSREHGTVHLYEETPEWTLAEYLSNVHGILPDIREGTNFDIGRYAAVGDSRWTKLLYHQWRAIAPLWPVAPTEMRYYELEERREALDWVTTANANPDKKSSNR